MNRYHIITAASCCVLILLGGCGGVRTDYSKVNLARVRGRVTLDDQPLADAIVIFEAPDQTFSIATTDESGDYRLMFNVEKAGVTPGPKVVRIRTQGGVTEDDSTEEIELDSGILDSGIDAERVPSCYNTESKLKVTVVEGSQKLNFNLKMDCSTTGPNG